MQEHTITETGADAPENENTVPRWMRVYAAAAAVLVLAVILTAAVTAVNKTVNPRLYRATVTAKGYDSQLTGERYLIRAKDEEDHEYIFEMSPSLFMGRKGVSRYIGDIHIGSEYVFTVRGEWLPFLSLYPNIYLAEYIEPEDPEEEAM